VVVPAVVLSLLASLVLVLGADIVALLFLGRFLAGVSSGIVFAAGTAWLRETSPPPIGTASPGAAARRAAMAMAVGFGLGPLVAGLLAQWAPAPMVTPFLPHIALMAIVLVVLRNAPETVAQGARHRVRPSVPGVRSRRFLGVVAPMAPWVFAAPAIAVALVPNVVGANHAADGIALVATVAALCALSGVLIQPLARRLDSHSQSNRAGIAGLMLLTVALALSAAAAQSQRTWLLLPCAIVLGCAYGLCLSAGLIEVQRLADSDALAGLTAAYYALTYLGFAAPFLFALAAGLAGYPVLLAIAAGLALVTTALVRRQSSQLQNRCDVGS
jgi:MFS family permease